MKRVFCATLGCDKNLVDSEALLGRFALKGIQPVNDPDSADIWVLNSCGFIDAARADSEETLRSLIENKEDRTLVVFGCWSQEHGEEIQSRFPEVDIVAGVGQFDRVVAACLGGIPDTGSVKTPAAVDFPLAGPPLVEDPMAVDYTGLVGRPLLTPPHVAFVKIGEGCNCSCTFCRIPLIRGKQRSRQVDEIVTEVRGHVARGVTEIQLVSQNTSDFGRDTGQTLLELVTGLNQVDGLRRLRLLYLYAGMVSVDDLRRMLELEKVAPYLEIPIQHASPRILKAMNRPGGAKASPDFFHALRKDRPDLVLRSTALLGFPGEEDEDVSVLADFLAAVEFDHLGTYRFSPEKGTPAAEMPDRVPDEVIHDREALIMDLQADISLGRQQTRLGRKFSAVVDEIIRPGADGSEEASRILESFSEGVWADEREREAFGGVLGSEVSLALCRSYHFGYDLDGIIVMPAAGLQPGHWVDAEFRAVTPYDTWAANV
ncbi:MAG: MiaB/RimO family radical SAM methylthiotransferase [Candidatus Krumholzibacteriota bacterium]